MFSRPVPVSDAQGKSDDEGEPEETAHEVGKLLKYGGDDFIFNPTVPEGLLKRARARMKFLKRRFVASLPEGTQVQSKVDETTLAVSESDDEYEVPVESVCTPPSTQDADGCAIDTDIDRLTPITGTECKQDAGAAPLRHNYKSWSDLRPSTREILERNRMLLEDLRPALPAQKPIK